MAPTRPKQFLADLSKLGCGEGLQRDPCHDRHQNMKTRVIAMELRGPLTQSSNASALQSPKAPVYLFKETYVHMYIHLCIYRYPTIYVCIYVYVCMYIYIEICIYRYIYGYNGATWSLWGNGRQDPKSAKRPHRIGQGAELCRRGPAKAQLGTWIYTYIYIHIHMYIHICMYMYVCIYMYMYMYM